MALRERRTACEAPRVAARYESERGAALVIVVAVGMVLALMMSVLVVVAVNGTRQARSDADWNAALAAAYAGIDEYQSRLSTDTSYYRFGNPASSFSSASSVTAPPTTNLAFGLGASGTWANVGGSDARARFRYEVDNSKYATTGRIRVRSTGQVGDAVRTITADLKQQGFIDFLYFTDFEVQDPAIVGKPSSTGCWVDPTTKTTLKYAWDSRTGSCNEITFAASDILSGPVHSNDTIRACSTRFKGAVTTANPVSPFITNTCGTPAKFDLAGYPAYGGGVIGMPATNSELKKETRSDLTSTDVPRPGCLYTGPTQVTFNSGGTMTVRSPYTKKTQIGNASATSGSAPSACGAVGTGTGQLGSSGGATIAVPENNVIYVQNVPTVTTDVNYRPTSGSGSVPSGFTCISNGWSFGGVTYPSANESPPTSTTYGCRAGDVYVKGSFHGALTVAAENYIFVTGDIKYANAQEDILGLVGNNAVWVYNPVDGSDATIQGNLDSTASDREIDAAILSVAHTFYVQNYNEGSLRGTLTVFGAIAQKFRGTVATGTDPVVTGYKKNYVYDNRFKYKAPPKFLNPVTTTYGVTTWVESAAAFNADGSAR